MPGSQTPKLRPAARCERITRLVPIATLFALGTANCETGSRPDPDSFDTPGRGVEDAEIDFDTTHQRMVGFGASSAWTAQELPESLADDFFSAEDGIGLSLMRVRIDPAGDTWERDTARQALARGARVWAAPWSPPGNWKDNGSATWGGSLLRSHYQDWADRLAAFAKSMADDGLPLFGLSPQNEPGFVREWETCEWTTTELTEFVRDYLGPALEREGVETPIIAPETPNWTSLPDYGDALLEDAEARRFLGAIATHSYGGTAFEYEALADHGLLLWQTEMSDDGAFDNGMGSAIRVARVIHQHLTVAQVSAWQYWWLIPGGPDTNAALTNDGTLTRRAYALGNYSKFVRPGFVRVSATVSPQGDVFVTAFRDPDSDRIAIVAINDRSRSVSQTFVLRGASPTEVVPWETSDERALAERSGVTVEDGQFEYSLPADSVTTFVGGFGSSEAGAGGSAGATGESGNAGGGAGG